MDRYFVYERNSDLGSVEERVRRFFGGTTEKVTGCGEGDGQEN